MLSLVGVTYTKCPATGYWGVVCYPYASTRYIGRPHYRQRAYVMGSGATEPVVYVGILPYPIVRP